MTDLGFTQDTFTPENLFVPGFPVLTKPVTVVSGAVIEKNTVLGKITKGAATSAAKSGGNTGNGTLTLDATTPILARAKVGIYLIRCIAAATNGGIFRVTDPEGYVLGDVAVGDTFANQIKFAIADGLADFIVGDGFNVTIAAGSGQVEAYNPANIDGSEVADSVLAAKVDATSEATVGTAYRTGHFNEAAVAGLDAAAKLQLEKKSIFFSTIQ